MTSVEHNGSSFEPHRILTVDADTEGTAVLATLLRFNPNGVTTARGHTPRDAVALARDFGPNAAIVDPSLQTVSGGVIAGAVPAGCASAKPMRIALTGSRTTGDGIEPPRIFDPVLPKPSNRTRWWT